MIWLNKEINVSSDELNKIFKKRDMDNSGSSFFLLILSLLKI